MKVKHSRLKRLLSPMGFADSCIDKQSITFYRQDIRKDLFQKVHVDCQGRHDEAVYGNVSCSVVRFVHLKIEVQRHLLKLDRNTDRNWTIIENNDEAMDWERRFAALAPEMAEAYAQERGDELLTRTGYARHRSADHLRRLDPTISHQQQIGTIESNFGPGLRKNAVRLAEWPGVMQRFGAEELYLLACCAVLSGSEESDFIGENPLNNNELMWQIQLVADGIMSWGTTFQKP